jgi:group I intron endonuclease
MFIYKITNIITQKSYIGQTKRTIQRRFNSHISEAKRNLYDTHLHRSIRKHGADKFTVELIEECDANNISDREIFWIKELNTKSPKGYNLHDGGYGGCLNPSDELRKKLSDAKKGSVPWNKDKDKQFMNKYVPVIKVKKTKKSLKLTKYCLLCSSVFVCRHKQRKFCSRSCSCTYSNKNRKMRITKENKISTSIPIIKCCPKCLNEFVTNTSGREKIYCSKSCAASVNATKVKTNGMKNIITRQKFSDQVTGRKRKYNTDGSWSWYYLEKNKEP